MATDTLLQRLELFGNRLFSLETCKLMPQILGQPEIISFDAAFDIVDDFETTSRGAGGFGSSGHN